MPRCDPALWEIIRTWPLPHRPEWDGGARPKRVCESFAQTLAMDRNWTAEAAARVEEAYRQFL